MLTSKEILEKYLAFFKGQKHVQIPNVSLIPENDSTLLFVNAGMFPLVPYLMGQPHPEGTKLTNVQRCVRMDDIDEVGDASHTTAFHMLGNWSLNDYFKKEQLTWAYEFYIEQLGLDVNKIYATVYKGADQIEKDTESIEILKQIFARYDIDAKEEERIFACGKPNWWQRGEAVGELGGPSSEVFYYLGKDSPNGKHPETHEDEFLEIGNSVFLQYKKTENGWEELAQKNVDFGGGLERIALAVQDKQDIYQTDNFWPIIEKTQSLSNKKYQEHVRQFRILADHIRGAVFLAMDGVTPSNKDQGYILRRLLRRMVRAGRQLGIERDISVELVPVVTEMFAWLYPKLPSKTQAIQGLFEEEENKFRKTLERGDKEFNKTVRSFIVNETQEPKERTYARKAFEMYQSLGYPEEIFLEELTETNPDLGIDKNKFYEEFEKLQKEHQEQSKAGAEQKFKGGLADQSEMTTKYHTATHLLQWALQQTLGKHVTQKGSNITQERARFDFANPAKLTPEEISKVENLVNQKVKEGVSVKYVDMPKEEALKINAGHQDLSKYGDIVKVYYIGNNLETAISKEFCGGPHVENTRELLPVKIYKQENIGKGLIRVYMKFA